MEGILLATGDARLRADLPVRLLEYGRVTLADSAALALDLAAKVHPRAILVDATLVRPPQSDQSEAAALIPWRKAVGGAALIMLSPEAEARRALALVRAGADDYLTLPLGDEDLAAVLSGLARPAVETGTADAVWREADWRPEIREMVRTRSQVMRQVYDRILSVAPTKATVLLGGETGTGKSLMARLIHLQSSRAEGPFLTVHCGSIPDTLLESELFGHEKGAFTGAHRRKLGKFQLADGGTIFLDEIGTISAAAQVKLLQVLQESSFSRVGGETSINVDVRVVAATNLDLKAACAAGSFRQDLYYRLNVFHIGLPPLRDRAEDIPLLVETFLARLNRVHNKTIKGVEPGLLEALVAYAWPGNIRELENTLERAYILETGSRLSPASLPPELAPFETASPGPAPLLGGEAPTLAQVRRLAVEEAERAYLAGLLAANQGRVDRTAAQAGITPRQLRNLLTKYGLNRRDYL